MSRRILAVVVLVPLLLPFFISLFIFGESNASDMIRFYITFGSLLCAVFTALFTGGSVSDRTFKNMIATGAKRSCVYLADILTTVIVTFAGFLIYMGMAMIFFDICAADNILYSVTAVLFWLLFFCSLYVLVNTYFSSKIFAVFLSMIFIFAVMIIGSNLDLTLSEPKYASGKRDDILITIENPHYISGSKREVYAFFSDSNPFSLQYYTPNRETLIKTAELTLPLTVLVTIGGAYAFSRKGLD